MDGEMEYSKISPRIMNKKNINFHKEKEMFEYLSCSDMESNKILLRMTGKFAVKTT